MGQILILGDGGWGTALGCLLARKGEKVVLWSAFPDYAARMAKKRENVKFLPGVRLPRGIRVTGDAAEGRDADFIVMAYPTPYMRKVLKGVAAKLGAHTPLLSVSKGIEVKTLLRPTQVAREALGRRPMASLSGPSHAEEVARSMPTSVVVASRNQDLARHLQKRFMTPSFRVYTNDDITGVELGGALKNVFAVAAGICDGLGLGDNAKAALMSRSIAEMSRLGAAMGGNLSTFAGLSGVGDLIVTCYSQHGRNRAVGEALGRGKRLKQILAGSEMVPEGVWTVKSARTLAERFRVDMPITNEVYRILYRGAKPARAVARLMSRMARPETD